MLARDVTVGMVTPPAMITFIAQTICRLTSLDVHVHVHVAVSYNVKLHVPSTAAVLQVHVY